MEFGKNIYEIVTLFYVGCWSRGKRPARRVHPVRNYFPESQRRVENPPRTTSHQLPEESHRASRIRAQTFQSPRTNAKNYYCQPQNGFVIDQKNIFCFEGEDGNRKEII